MDLKKEISGNFLGQMDIDGPTNVTVNSLRYAELKGEDRAKVVIKLDELDKEWILNKTNMKRLCHIFQTTETNSWIGKQFNIYNDPDVEFGGKIVGGLRAQRAQIARPAVADVEAESDDIPF